MHRLRISLFKPCIVAFLTLAIVSVSACGTILYPQRSGQVSGRIDPGVAVLDGVGLLFFLVPGVIAFAVDFSNGTIYYPGGKRLTSLDLDQAQVIHSGDKSLDAKTIQRLIKQRTGQSISFNNPTMQAQRATHSQWQLLTQHQHPTSLAAL